CHRLQGPQQDAKLRTAEVGRRQSLNSPTEGDVMTQSEICNNATS
ncbi:MAG: hypothetical protein ACI8PQ_002320, partial [Planctomycetota bacterium]